MKILAKLQEKAAGIHKQMGEMLDAAATENRDFTTEETAKYDGLEKDFKAAGVNIDRRQTFLDQQERQTEVTDIVDPAEAAKHIQVGRDNREKDPQLGFARGMGEFALAVRGAFDPSHKVIDDRLKYCAAASGMNVAIGSEGGFLIPPAFSQVIWDGMQADDANLLAETDNYTVEGESLTFNANAETSRATGSRWGGVRGYWLAEAAQMTGSRPKFRQLKLEPKGLAVMIYCTDKLLANVKALNQYLTRAAIAEIGFLTSDAIISGDGSGKPLGILNSPSLVTIAKETNQAADTVVSQNIIKMFARLHAKARVNALWLYNQEIEERLITMTINVGTGGVPVFLPAGGLSEAPYARILGKPARPIEFCSALGDVGDIILTDLKSYASGVKGDVRSDMSMHLRFDYNETAFRFLFDVDGQPWLASALTPYKGNNTLSTAVALAAR